MKRGLKAVYFLIVIILVIAVGVTIYTKSFSEEKNKFNRGGVLMSASGSCEGFCGEQSPDGCWCDDLCSGIGDCCSDFNICPNFVPKCSTHQQCGGLQYFPCYTTGCFDGMCKAIFKPAGTDCIKDSKVIIDSKKAWGNNGETLFAKARCDGEYICVGCYDEGSKATNFGFAGGATWDPGGYFEGNVDKCVSESGKGIKISDVECDDTGSYPKLKVSVKDCYDDFGKKEVCLVYPLSAAYKYNIHTTQYRYEMSIAKCGMCYELNNLKEDYYFVKSCRTCKPCNKNEFYDSSKEECVNLATGKRRSIGCPKCAGKSYNPDVEYCCWKGNLAKEFLKKKCNDPNPCPDLTLSSGKNCSITYNGGVPTEDGCCPNFANCPNIKDPVKEFLECLAGYNECKINALCDGCHDTSTSTHYSDCSVDISYTTARDKIKSCGLTIVFPPSGGVGTCIDEGTHFHCQVCEIKKVVGDCGTAHSTPGCSNAVCSNAVCFYDSYCCEMQWDDICVSEAEQEPACLV